MADELVAFLRGRLDEDEQTARACAGAPWEVEIPPMVHVCVQARRDNKWKWGRLGYVATVERDEDRAHIARHDPARVLAEVDAKRQILARHEELRAASREDGLIGDVTEEYQEFLLRVLALPYADHPDYREEWRP